ncbi:MAG: hypothetical protein HWN65_06015 [Candidatus Helarchaeota archaeon]|nr:hypothetical protein [Candidatus Helarchaeota archaeon]
MNGDYDPNQVPEDLRFDVAHVNEYLMNYGIKCILDLNTDPKYSSGNYYTIPNEKESGVKSLFLPDLQKLVKNHIENDEKLLIEVFITGEMHEIFMIEYLKADIDRILDEFDLDYTFLIGLTDNERLAETKKTIHFTPKPPQVNYGWENEEQMDENDFKTQFNFDLSLIKDLGTIININNVLFDFSEIVYWQAAIDDYDL